jgi:LysR family nitrogen assimilation transcriptional regulator
MLRVWAVNSRQMEYFLRIADLGSFRKASESLRIAQPALTRQIKNLELELGVELLNRHSDGVTPTGAGALLVERARFILRQTEQARADVMAEGTTPRGTVAFGAPASIAGILFPRLAATYLATYPDVRLRFYDGVGRLFDWLMNDEIDLAVLPDSRLATQRNLSLIRFAGEPVYLVGPPGHFRAGESCSLQEVLERPLILAAPPSTVRSWLDAAVDEAGGRLNVKVEAESPPIQKDLVRAGLGYALLPHSAIWDAFQRGDISICVVEGRSLDRVLAWRADRPVTPAVQRMIEFTQAEIGALAFEGAFGRDSRRTESAALA